MRELKEETGYVGVAEQTSPVMFNGRSEMIEMFSLCAASDRLLVFRPGYVQYQLEYGPCARGHGTSREPKPQART